MSHKTLPIIPATLSILMFYVAIGDIKIFLTTSDVPATVSLADVLQSGAIQNRHIILSDFILADYVVFVGNNKTDAFVPAVTVDAAKKYFSELDEAAYATLFIEGEDDPIFQPQKFPMLVWVRNTNEADAYRLLMNDPLQGIIYQGGEGLDSNVRFTLADSYRGVNIDNLLLLSLNESRPSIIRIVLLCVVGVLSGILAFGLVFWHKPREDNGDDYRPLYQPVRTQEYR